MTLIFSFIEAIYSSTSLLINHDTVIIIVHT